MSRRASRTVPASSQTGKEELYFHKISYSQNVTKKKTNKRQTKSSTISYLIFQPKATPRRFFLIGPRANTSSARAPTTRVVLYDVLLQTHSRVKASTAVERTITTIVAPFYQSASLPAMCRKGMVEKGLRLYKEYQQLTVANKSSPEKRAKDFSRRCEDFVRQLDEVFFVPAHGTTDFLKPPEKEIFLALKVMTAISYTQQQSNNNNNNNNNRTTTTEQQQ